jgi:hypothetical protein
MSDGANSADARSEMRGLIIGSPEQHGLEKSRCLNDLQIALHKLSFADIDDDIAMPLYTSDVVYVDLQGL